jgi:hypothetical protein
MMVRLSPNIPFSVLPVLESVKSFFDEIFVPIGEEATQVINRKIPSLHSYWFINSPDTTALASIERQLYKKSLHRFTAINLWLKLKRTTNHLTAPQKQPK